MHDTHAVALVFSLLSLQLVVKGIDRLLQEGHLNLLLLLDVTVLDHNLLFFFIHKVLELFDHANLQFFVVIDALGDPVNGILEQFHVALIFTNRLVGSTDGRLHSLLLKAKGLDQEAEVGVKRIERSELLIFQVRLIPQLLSLELLWRDLFLEFLDAIIENEFELLKLLSLFLQLEDLVLTITD